MESIKKQLLKRILPLILSLVIIFTSSVYPEKKVKAEALTLTFVAVTVIAGIIISGLAASGAISGDYTVTAPDLSAIQEKAQANLQAAGANAVEQANRLGEAIKSGAESAKIKALASGAVIYAFLQAIQETLFNHSYSEQPTVSDSYDGILMYLQNGSYITYYGSRSYLHSVPLRQPVFKSIDSGRFYQFSFGDSTIYSANLGAAYVCRLYDVNHVFIDSFSASGANRNEYGDVIVYSNSKLGFDYYDAKQKMFIDAFLGNYVIDPTVSKISEKGSVTLPTRLPTTIVNNINNWDGTSDLVLAPPLPYDIPTGEDLVIDPSYVGEGTVDPPTPTTDPDNPPSEEEGITLPWLAALLGLLGLGQLTGIDEGVKSGIDNLVDSITNTVQDVYDGVRDWADTASSTIAQGIEGVRAKLGEIAGVITGGLALGIESIQSVLGSIAETIGHAFDPPSKNVDWDKLKNIQLFNKFPFSIPSDLYYLFGLVAADPAAPCVKIPFDMTFLGGENIDATVDLATYDNVAAIIRSFEFIAFVIGMLYLTKSLIWK